jgi:hypothetical protein
MRKLHLACFAALAAALPAGAYIEALYPLQQFVAETEVIAEGVIEKADTANKTCVVKIERSLKGKCIYEQVRMNLSGGQFWHSDVIMRHMVVGAPAILFYDPSRRAEIYINRFFMQLYGDAGAPPEKAWWTYTHIEIRCNRTYNGTTEDFSKLLKSILAGKEKAPAPDAKIPPITKEAVDALPVWGTPNVDPASLPACFRKRDPNAPIVATPVAVNAEGFVMRWAMLGPVGLGPEGANHSEAGQKAFFDREWWPGLKASQPKAGDKVSIGGTELRWDVLESTDFYADLGVPENSIHFLAAHVVSEADVADAVLLTGSDDSAIWWLNGTEVQRVYSGRGIAKDQDRSKPVALRKGVNVLLGAVINGGGPTGGCARFVDKDGKPLAGLKAGGQPPR